MMRQENTLWERNNSDMYSLTTFMVYKIILKQYNKKEKSHEIPFCVRSGGIRKTRGKKEGEERKDMQSKIVECIDDYSPSDDYESEMNNELTIQVCFKAGKFYICEPDEDPNIVRLKSQEINAQVMRRAYERHFRPITTFDTGKRIEI